MTHRHRRFSGFAVTKEVADASKTRISNTPQSITFQSAVVHIFSMPRERQASSTELYWYYTGMIYGRSGLTASWCLKGRSRIYNIVGGTNQLTRFIFLYSGQMKTQAPNNKEKSMFNDTIKIMFMWKTVITQTGNYCDLWLSGRVRSIAKCDYSLRRVCLSVRTSECNNSGSHWTDFHGILHLSIFFFENPSNKYNFH